MKIGQMFNYCYLVNEWKFVFYSLLITPNYCVSRCLCMAAPMPRGRTLPVRCYTLIVNRGVGRGVGVIVRTING
jgi:hypothetical protein